MRRKPSGRPADRDTSRDAAAAFRAWLGDRGTRPPQLDRFLSRARLSADVVAGVDRLARRAVALLADPADGGAPLWDQLRGVDPARLAAASRAPLPDPIAAARASSDPRRRCAAYGVAPGFGALLAPRFAAWGDARARAWLDRQDTRPPLWIRVRDRAAVGRLRSLGFDVRGDGPAYTISGPGDPRVAQRDGGFEIQDRASQEVAELASTRPGQRAWDVCAGRGGKTMVLADGLAGRGAVWATDVDERALADLKIRARRAGNAGVVRIARWDGETLPDAGPEAKRGFDVVLVDAPCSATGTWRRNPDARVRTDPAEVPSLAALQRRLLGLAAGRVAPGGRLVYATCSALPAEDELVDPGTGWVRRTERLAGPPDLDADTLYGAVWLRG